MSTVTKPDGLAQLEMLRRHLMDQEFVLVVPLDRLDAVHPVVSSREEDQEVLVRRQESGLDLFIGRPVPMVALLDDPLGMPEVGQSEPLLAEGLEDVEDDEHLRVLDVSDHPVPGVSPVCRPPAGCGCSRNPRGSGNRPSVSGRGGRNRRSAGIRARPGRERRPGRCTGIRPSSGPNRSFPAGRRAGCGNSPGGRHRTDRTACNPCSRRHGGVPSPPDMSRTRLFSSAWPWVIFSSSTGIVSRR